MFLPSVALVAVLTTTDAAVIDAAFARWEAAARDMKSLHVEFDATDSDPVLKRETRLAYTLRLLRTPDGVVGDVKGLPDNAARLLLRDDTTYLLNPANKGALRIRLEEWVPAVVLLNRGRVEKRFAVTVDKRDEWYTYLKLTPKDKDLRTRDALLVVPHRKNDTLPVGLPRVVIHNEPDRTTRWDVTKWVMNGDNPPKAEEFVLPSEKDGWTISEWTWPPKWKTK